MDKNTKKAFEQNEKIKDENMYQLLEEVEEITEEGQVFSAGCLAYCAH